MKINLLIIMSVFLASACSPATVNQSEPTGELAVDEPVETTVPATEDSVADDGTDADEKEAEPGAERAETEPVDEETAPVAGEEAPELDPEPDSPDSSPDTTEIPPIGPDSKLFFGTTVNQNPRAGYGPQVILGQGGGQLASHEKEVMEVLVMVVDTTDHAFAGTNAQRDTYLLAKFNEYNAHLGPYWMENSFDMVDVNLTMENEILHLSGHFDDYFNKSFVQPSLTSSGFGTASTYPLTLTGAETVILQVRDSDFGDTEIQIVPTPGTYPDLLAMLTEYFNQCQTAADAKRADWVTCSMVVPPTGPELKLELDDEFVDNGAFIRVTGGAGLELTGFDGPLEYPGDPDSEPVLQAGLVGKEVAGGFPVTATGVETVEIKVSDKDSRTRQYTWTLPAWTLPGAGLGWEAIAGTLLATINTEFDWVESFDADPQKVALRVKKDFNGEDASIRIIGGTGLHLLGLDGPTRIDGVVTTNRTLACKGARNFVAEGLSRYIEARVAEDAVLSITGVDESDKLLVDSLIAKYNSFMVLFADDFIEDLNGNPTTLPGSRRACADSSASYDLNIAGADAIQIQAGYMTGPAYDKWTTWAHELGHNLGFLDIYEKDYHHDDFDDKYDYVNEWGLMNSQANASHVIAYHKLFYSDYDWGIKWIDPVHVFDLTAPGTGETKTQNYTVIPIEYPAEVYADLGSDEAPLAHAIRLPLADDHHIFIENRQPGYSYSQDLPGKYGIASPAAIALPPSGGIFITDTINPYKMTDTGWDPDPLIGEEGVFRSPVHTLNPHSTTWTNVFLTVGAVPASEHRARSLIEPGYPGGPETLDLSTTYPAYEGITIGVVNTIPDPGRPDAIEVKVQWGPGDFIQPGIRAWHAPETYGTHDIWIDWLGNGENLYIGVDPPLGNGDATHYSVDGSVDNIIRARIYNKGNVDALDVKVLFEVNEIGMGDDGDFSLEGLSNKGQDGPKDIPAGGHVDFQVTWSPEVSPAILADLVTDGSTKKLLHTCVQVRIVETGGSTGNPNLGDFDLGDNKAQENIFDFHPTAGSPYGPEDFEFQVNNDFDFPVEVKLMPTGLIPGLDLELEQDYLVLSPYENRVLKGRFHTDVELIPPGSRHSIPVNIHAFLATQDSWDPFGGVTINVYPVEASDIQFTSLQQIGRTSDGLPNIAVFGTLLGPDAGDQSVDAALSHELGTTYGGSTYTNSDGSFVIPLGSVPLGSGNLMIYYFGNDMAPTIMGPLAVIAPSDSTAATDTPEPTATDTLVPTVTSTPAPTATNTLAPTATDTPVATRTHTPVATRTDTPVPTRTPTPRG